MMKFSTMAVLLALWSFASASEFYPSVIYQLDSKFSHHVIVVEKSTHTLYLYENDNQNPKLIKTYKIATGKNIGNKQAQGDEKTPEGIYQFQKFHPASELIAKYGKEGLIYGAGAFTMNYPNEIDRRNNKTGGGIWLHSTDNDERVSKGLDSRGCVVATDSDLKDISQYIDLGHTSIVVTQNLNFYTKSSWLKNKEDITKTIVTWADAWKEKDFAKYIDQYSRSDFQSSRGGYEAYKNYKKAIFSRSEVPQIAFRHISMMQFSDYAVVTMEQDYRSDLIQDIGKKTLYLKQDENYNWKIISEQFTRLPEETNIAFIPKMRFFNEANQVKTADDSGSI